MQIMLESEFSFRCKSAVPAPDYPMFEHHEITLPIPAPLVNQPRSASFSTRDQKPRATPRPAGAAAAAAAAAATANGQSQGSITAAASSSAPAATQRSASPTARAPAPSLAPDSVETERRSKRKLSRELASAARARKERQAAENAQNPVKPEDRWLCEFCEYESIFGRPPRALMRQYEIRDKRVREQDAERRRLLEKAKAKSRKGKKTNGSSKTSPQGSAIFPPTGQADTSQHHTAHGGDHMIPPPDSGASGGSGDGEPRGESGDDGRDWGGTGASQGVPVHGDGDSDAAESDEGPPGLFREFDLPTFTAQRPFTPQQIGQTRTG